MCTHKFNSDSDIDLLIESDSLNPFEQGEKLINLWNQFEDIFKRKVDLLTTVQQLINPTLKHNIEKTKQLFYDRTNRKIFVC